MFFLFFYNLKFVSHFDLLIKIKDLIIIIKRIDLRFINYLI